MAHYNSIRFVLFILIDWFHLVGLIHDVGKVMALWGEPQVGVFMYAIIHLNFIFSIT